MSDESDLKLNRLTISVHDFEKATGLFQEADKHSTDAVVHEALLTCALIHFCRPFTPNKREKEAQAASKLAIDEFGDLTEDEKALHKQCMEIRNKAIAHAEWSHYPTKRNAKTNVISGRRFSLTAAGINWPALARLTGKLAEQCHNKRAAYVRQS